jgi:hypothetical protein
VLALLGRVLAHTQALAETDAEVGRALKTRRLSRDASTSAEKVLEAEAVSAVRSAKEHAEAEAARANASLLELRAQYDAMQRRYEESEAALERTRRAATEVSLELEAAGWPLIAPLIRWIAPLIR